MSRPVWIEIGHDVLRVLSGGNVRQWELARDDHGRLTAATTERLRREVPDFLARPAWASRWPAWCAVGARGVSVRRLVLPAASSGADLESMVAMQVEAEFPLALDQLAWGFVPLGSGGAGAGREVLVIALKRDVIEEYRTLLEGCGLQPRFTLAAWARSAPGRASRAGAVLHLEAHSSEWAVFDDHGLQRVRQLPWGVAKLAEDYALETGRPLESAREALQGQVLGGGIEPAVEAVLKRVFGEMAGDAPDRPAVLGATSLPETWLVEAFRRAVPRPGGWAGSGAAGEGFAQVVRGLEQAAQEGALERLPEFRVPVVEATPELVRGLPWRWVAAAAALLVLVVVLPHLEVWWMKPGLERKLKSLKAEEPRLARLEAEWDFLRQLKQSQPPYLDALVVLTKSIPPGTQVESLNMNRQGDLVLRGMLRTGQDVVGFRSKLVESGFFATVVVDEQTPTPDRQQVNYRITARWKEASERERLPILALGESSPTNAAGPIPTQR